MMLRPVRLIAPVEAPVSLPEARDKVRADPNDTSDDATLTGLIAAAVDDLDGYDGALGRCLVTQTWRQDFAGWASVMRLPFPDAAVTSLTYRDANGETQTVAASNYRLFDEVGGPVLRFSPDWSFPTLDDDTAAGPPVSVTFTAGYGSAADVPARIKTAILIHVSALYDGDEDSDWRPTYDRLIGRCRVGQM